MRAPRRALRPVCKVDGKKWDGAEEKGERGVIVGEKEGENYTDRASGEKYLQLTDLSKWITCPISAAGVKERVERGSKQPGERERDAFIPVFRQIFEPRSGCFSSVQSIILPQKALESQ